MDDLMRRPVPREWRWENHSLDVYSQRNYFVRGGGYVSAAGGRCDCGAKFGLAANRSNMNAADVREEWMDHVETAYYGGRGMPDACESRRE